ncbi:hypothetical protein JQX30_04360 [Saccharopolyspora erythraea]|nr:hypothetical protein JQX30_04360 [Saccharopolyspora erythraea]
MRDDGVVTEQSRNRSSEADRKRRLAEVFGDVLPDTTSDERSQRGPAQTETERWYRENRPPHHDDHR